MRVNINNYSRNKRTYIWFWLGYQDMWDYINKMLNLKQPSFVNLSLFDRFSDIVEMYKHVHKCFKHSSLVAQKKKHNRSKVMTEELLGI